jgi:flagellar biogenesis protein FliO
VDDVPAGPAALPASESVAAEPAAAIEPPPPREPRALDVDMTPFQEAYDAQLAEAQAEITGEAAAEAPGRTDVTSLGIRAAGVLLAICGIIVLMGYAARRFGGKTPLLAGTALGRPMGRLYLDPKTVLHFVETGGRVLVIGASQGSIALITEFEAEAFNAAEETMPRTAVAARPTGGESAVVDALRRKQDAATATPGTPDIDSLRGDIQRLKEFLRESQRDGA